MILSKGGMEKNVAPQENMYPFIKDQDTGETLLHHAVSNCTAEIIQTIIAKGADLMLEDNKECFDACDKKNESSKLPLQVAIANKRSKYNLSYKSTSPLYYSTF